jgi:hypothetical protein
MLMAMFYCNVIQPLYTALRIQPNVPSRYQIYQDRVLRIDGPIGREIKENEYYIMKSL